jgi:hypothetical protein
MRILAALALVAAALAVPTAAWAYGSEVSASSCNASGGYVTRPAGTDIVVRQGWAATTKRYSLDFIHAQQTFVSINGGGPIDLSDDWTTPRPYSPSNWVTWVFYPTTIVLSPGQSMTFHYVTSLKRSVFDGFGYAAPGTVIESYCTVTGA